MFLYTIIGNEGLVENFKAQFKPDANGDGYLFFADDYGEGVPCSHAQHQSYVNEFEGCVRGSHRFMVRWAIAMCFFLIAAMSLAVWHFGVDILDKNDTVAKTLGALLFVIPLPYLFWKGNKVRKRPLHELVNNNPNASAVVSSGKRRSSKEIYVQRLRGMSPTGLGLGIFVGILGMGSSAYEYSNTGEFKLFFLMFPLILVSFIAIVWVRRNARQEDEKILLEQSLFNIKKAQDAWLELNRLVIHSSPLVEVQNSILSVRIPVKGTAEFKSAEPYRYFAEVQAALESNQGAFLLVMDWKEAVSDYFWKLETAIGNDAKLTLPALDKYPRDASLHFGSVLADAVVALDAAGYKQIFINDLSDSHNAILVKGDDVVQAVTALENLHLDYNINFPA